jgi:hypothetical protein
MTFCIIACDDENGKINDTENPTITITAPGEESFVKGPADIKAVATDNHKVKSISVFIDDILLKEVSDATIAAPWDTKAVADGMHILKVTAVDQNDNESSITREINVMNYFIKLKLVDLNLPATTRLWYFVAKTDGTVVDIEEVKAGTEQVVFDTPNDFDPNKKYFLAKYVSTRLEWTGAYDRSLILTHGFTNGTYTINQPIFYVSKPVVGTHTVTINNISPSFPTSYGDIYHYSQDSYSQNSQTWTYELTKNNASLYLAFLKDGLQKPRYMNLTGLNANEKTTVDYNNFKEMAGNTIEVSESVSELYSTVTAVDNSGQATYTVWNYWKGALIGNLVGPKHLFYYPDLFNKYVFNAREISSDGSSRYAITVSNTAPTQINRPHITMREFEYANRKLTVSFDGTFDEKKFIGSSTQNNGDTYLEVQLSESNYEQIVLPQLPLIILSQAGGFPPLENVFFKSASFTDYKSINTHKTVIDLSYDGSNKLYLGSPEVYIINKPIK